eukprot:COSAG01_NODE_13571_length_1566_cov_1.245399_1_plen_52_part_10
MEAAAVVLSASGGGAPLVVDWDESCAVDGQGALTQIFRTGGPDSPALDVDIL